LPPGKLRERRKESGQHDFVAQAPPPPKASKGLDNLIGSFFDFKKGLCASDESLS